MCVNCTTEGDDKLYYEAAGVASSSGLSFDNQDIYLCQNGSSEIIKSNAYNATCAGLKLINGGKAYNSGYGAACSNTTSTYPCRLCVKDAYAQNALKCMCLDDNVNITCNSKPKYRCENRTLVLINQAEIPTPPDNPHQPE